jgi:hypothetical protein
VLPSITHSDYLKASMGRSQRRGVGIVAAGGVLALVLVVLVAWAAGGVPGRAHVAGHLPHRANAAITQNGEMIASGHRPVPAGRVRVSR